MILWTRHLMKMRPLRSRHYLQHRDTFGLPWSSGLPEVSDGSSFCNPHLPGAHGEACLSELQSLSHKQRKIIGLPEQHLPLMFDHHPDLSGKLEG